MRQDKLWILTTQRGWKVCFHATAALSRCEFLGEHLNALLLTAPFVFLSLSDRLTSAMETSSSRAGEKKDKMDGFGDLPKKPSPSETRGKTGCVGVRLPASQSGWVQVLQALSQRGQRGGANTSDEIYISKIKCHLGSRHSWLSSGLIRYSSSQRWLTVAVW